MTFLQSTTPSNYDYVFYKGVSMLDIFVFKKKKKRKKVKP